MSVSIIEFPNCYFINDPCKEDPNIGILEIAQLLNATLHFPLTHYNDGTHDVSRPQFAGNETLSIAGDVALYNKKFDGVLQRIVLDGDMPVVIRATEKLYNRAVVTDDGSKFHVTKKIIQIDDYIQIDPPQE